MCRRALTAIVGITAMSAAAGPASADERASDEPLVTPVQGTDVHLAVIASLASGEIFEPVSIAPDVFFGATDGLSVGVTHSPRAQSGFATGAGGGLCATGKGACPRIYTGAGVAARFRLLAGAAELAADIGFISPSVHDPVALSVKAGLLARVHLGPLSLWFSPNLWVGLAARTKDREPFNRDLAHLPVRVSFLFVDTFDVGLEGGVRGPLEDALESFEVPLAAVISVDVTRTHRIGLTFGFENLAGRDGGVGERTVSLFATSAL